MDTGRIRVVIADDHSVIRSGVIALLKDARDVEFIGEAADAEQAVSMAQSRHPDVMIVDLSMPGGGLEAIRRISENSPPIRILAFTMHDDVSHLRSVLAAGGHGYVVKTAGPAVLHKAIRTIYSGRTYFDVALSEETPAVQCQDCACQTLSRREQEVLSRLAQGYTQREVAEQLKLSVRTVETYRNRLSDKIGATSRADLVRFALEHGLLQAPEKLTSG